VGRLGFGVLNPIALNRSLISVPGGVHRNLLSKMVSGSDDSGLGAGARAGEFLTNASFLAGDMGYSCLRMPLASDLRHLGGVKKK
jgi:hypothetical protein